MLETFRLDGMSEEGEIVCKSMNGHDEEITWIKTVRNKRTSCHSPYSQYKSSVILRPSE